MNFIIYDLEATCWKDDPRRERQQEVIEIGAVKVNGYGEIIGEFCRFIRPVYHPHLSSFCQELTSISQSQVERADKFTKVTEDFQDFAEIFDEDFLLCSWGNFDWKILANNCRLHDMEDDWIIKNHINLKSQYSDIKKLRRPCGLKRAVENEGFEFEGTHHRGIDDAKNLVKVFRELFDEWRY